MSLTRRVASGVKTTFAASLASAALQAVTMVVMVRLVSAHDYGAYAIAVVVASVSTWFVTSALERSIVTSGDESQMFGRALPVGLVVTSAGLVAMAIAALVSASGVIELPLGPIAVILAAQAIAGFSIVPRVLLRSRLRFGWVVVAELVAQVVGTGLAGIALALLGWGVYAVVGAAVVYSLVVLVTYLLVVPRSVFWPVARAGTGGLLFGALRTSQTNFVEVVSGQIPVLVISWLGQATLGVFNRAYNLVQLPMQLMITSINRVFVSALVAVSTEPERQRRGARLLTKVVAAATTPVCFGIAGAAREFTDVIMGPGWAAAVPAVPFIAISTWGVVTAQAFATIIEAARHFEAKARLQFVAGIILLVAMAAGAVFGLAGGMAGMAIGGVALLVALGAYCGSLLEVGWRAVAGWLAPGFGAGLVCLAWSLAVSALSPFAEIVTFGIQIAGCGALAGAFLLAFDRALVREVLAAVRGR